ncbi:heparinase II/III family protein [Falsibacillus albus]|uniref:Heparinase n=1 Tax=Falsibacillus albus TaxID=2478915 RepID=A0A3L7JX62_9BACI|nr:heparinase II/III-family protein [Falsibacillus albus]RLQ94864.1 heparinase [Falsibacillus albus]
MDTFQVLKDLKPHPRILFNNEEIVEMKSRVDVTEVSGGAIRFDEIWREIELLAEKYASEKEFSVSYPSCDIVLNIPLPLVQLEPVEDPPGYTDYPYWTMYSRAIEERIKVLSVAYGMTRKDSFASKIKEYLFSLSAFSRWYEFPKRGAEGSLSIAHFVLAVSIGYDSIYNTLASEEIWIVNQAIFEKGLKLLGIDLNNHDSHNIIASKRVAMFIGALTILEEDNKGAIDPFLQNSSEYIIRYMNNRLVEPEIEGLLYLNVAARHVLMAADILKRSTGNDELITHKYFSLLPELFLYMLGTGGQSSFVNFSDSFYKLDVSYLMAVIASNTDHPVCSWYIHQFFEKKLDILLEFRKIPPPIHPDFYYKNKCSKIFPTIGWAAFRSGWGKKDHLLAFTSSESAKDHNHFDQNNFVLHTAGEWLITNPGYQDYVEGPKREYTLGTVGHNSMLADGKGQLNRGRSRFVDWYSSEGFSFIIGEAADAYDSCISGWERKIIHIDKRYFVIIDKVRKEKPETKLSFLFHTPSRIEAGGMVLRPGDRAQERTVKFIGEHSEAAISVCYPFKADSKVCHYTGAEQYGTFLEVVPQEIQEVQYMATLIQPLDPREGKPKQSPYTLKHSGALFDLKVENEDTVDYLLMNEERTCVHQSTEDGIVRLAGEQGWVSFNQGSKNLR